MNPRFLANLRRVYGSYKGVDDTQVPVEGDLVEDLAGFYECIRSENARMNILSQDDVEELYKVTNLQGKSITVHMSKWDLGFYKKNKLYVANMSD